MIRVVLIEDQTMMRDALVTLLDLERDIDVVGAVATAEAAMTTIDEVRPDVALVDIELPGMDGLALAEMLTDVAPTCRVVIVTTFGRPGYLRRAIAANVAGFVLKDMSAGELASVVRQVYEGERVIDAALALSALREGDDPLTRRERDVLRVARESMSIAEIAGRLYLSEGTVRNYLSSAIQKLGVRNRAEAIATAEQKGWL